MPDFLKTLKVDHPIIQAPMAGGGDTPDLVAAVSEAGGMGFFGAAYSSPEQIRAYGAAVRSRTARPFGVNLFAPAPSEPVADAEGALQALAAYYAELNLEPPPRPELSPYTFDERLDAALSIDAAALSFTFGLLPESAVHKTKTAGVPLLGTATTVAEAQALERLGVDAIIAQGSEAGGHRGTFLRPFSESLIGTIALVPQIVDAVSLPVIASGGIMDGRGIAAALCLGAVGVQIGTAFLTTGEAGVPPCYKQAILEAPEDSLVLTSAFSGRPARGITNRFIREMHAGGGPVLPFPLQNALTRPIRSAAGKAGDASLLSLWAGQGLRMARRRTASDLVGELVKETGDALRRAQSRADR